MRILNEECAKRFWREHPQMEKPLRRFLSIAAKEEWTSFLAIRRVFPAADQVVVASGARVIVFNFGHKASRMIAVVAYAERPPILSLLRIMTHDEYERNRWRANL